MQLLKATELKNELSTIRDYDVGYLDEIRQKIRDSTTQLASMMKKHKEEEQKHRDSLELLDKMFKEKLQESQKEIASLEKRKEKALIPVSVIKKEWKQKMDEVLEQFGLFQKTNEEIIALRNTLNAQKEKYDSLGNQLQETFVQVKELEISRSRYLKETKEELRIAQEIRQKLIDCHTLTQEEVLQWKKDIDEKEGDLAREHQSISMQKEELLEIQRKITDDRMKLKSAMDLWRQEHGMTTT